MPPLFILLFALSTSLQLAPNATCAGQTEPLSRACEASAIHLYLDQKTVLAGGAETVIVAEVLTPAMANVRDDIEVTFILQKEDQTVRRTGKTKNGIAQARLNAGTVSGPAYIWAQIGEVRSATQSLLVLAGPPRNFKLAMTGCRAGVSCQIESINLRDRFGNRVPDGLVGLLKIYSGTDLILQEQVQTVRGSVSANWSKPDRGARIELVFADQRATLKVPAR